MLASEESKEKLLTLVDYYLKYIKSYSTLEISYDYTIDNYRLGENVFILKRQIRIGTLKDEFVDIVNTIPWSTNEKALHWNDWVKLCELEFEELSKISYIPSNIIHNNFYDVSKWFTRQYKQLSKLQPEQRNIITNIYNSIICDSKKNKDKNTIPIDKENESDILPSKIESSLNYWEIRMKFFKLLSNNDEWEKWYKLTALYISKGRKINKSKTYKDYQIGQWLLYNIEKYDLLDYDKQIQLLRITTSFEEFYFDVVNGCYSTNTREVITNTQILNGEYYDKDISYINHYSNITSLIYTALTWDEWYNNFINLDNTIINIEKKAYNIPLWLEFQIKNLTTLSDTRKNKLISFIFSHFIKIRNLYPVAYNILLTHYANIVTKLDFPLEYTTTYNENKPPDFPRAYTWNEWATFLLKFGSFEDEHGYTYNAHKWKNIQIHNFNSLNDKQQDFIINFVNHISQIPQRYWNKYKYQVDSYFPYTDPDINDTNYEKCYSKAEPSCQQHSVLEIASSFYYNNEYEITYQECKFILKNIL